MFGDFVEKLHQKLPQKLDTPLIINVILSIAAIALIRALAISILRQYRLRKLPLVNGVGVFESSQKAKQNFLFNAEGLLENGFTKVSYRFRPSHFDYMRVVNTHIYLKSTKAFRMATDDSEVLILSPDYIDEIRNDKRLSLTHALAEVCKN